MKTTLCLKSPEKTRFEELHLYCLHCSDFGYLEMELLEFQDSPISKDRFYDLRATLEKLECDEMTNDSTVGSSKSEIQAGNAHLNPSA